VAMPTFGGLRVSVGLASNAHDVQRFLAFAETTYRDRGAQRADLAPRVRC